MSRSGFTEFPIQSAGRNDAQAPACSAIAPHGCGVWSAVTTSPAVPTQPGPPLTRLSVVIPARDEEGALPETLTHLHAECLRHHVPHEIVVVDDGSTDGTWSVLETLRAQIPTLQPIRNLGEHGFGRAITCGLRAATGDAAVIFMADESDDPRDVIQYWRTLNDGWDCVFGSRFVRGGRVVDYPRLKLALNRLTNFGIRLLFGIPLNDTTNAFKAYRMSVIRGCEPIIAPHFNLTVELPLKSIVRGYSWTVVPITWRNRRHGESKLKLKEMGSRYFFIVAYVWLEKYFSRGDYRKPAVGVPVADRSSRADAEQVPYERASGRSST